MATTLRTDHLGPDMSWAAFVAVAALGWLALLVAIALLIHGRAWVGVRAREIGRSLVGRVRAEHALLGLALAAPREPAVKAARTDAARRDRGIADGHARRPRP